MKMKLLTTMAVTGLMTIFLATTSAATEKPNIVLINMDNFGYGELGVYGGGIIRGGATPRIDKLATEGMRLDEFQCRGAVHAQPCSANDRPLCRTHGERYCTAPNRELWLDPVGIHHG